MNSLFNVFKRGSCRPSYFPKIHSLPGVFYLFFHHFCHIPPMISCSPLPLLVNATFSPQILLLVCMYVYARMYVPVHLVRVSYIGMDEGLFSQARAICQWNSRIRVGPSLSRSCLGNHHFCEFWGPLPAHVQKGTFVNTPPPALRLSRFLRPLLLCSLSLEE